MFICDLSSGHGRDFTLQAYGENNEVCPASSKRVKTTQFFQDYDRLPDL